MIVSVLASIVAGVGVLAIEHYQKVFGVVALVPALCALAASQLKLVEKTSWFYRKQRELTALARQVTVARKRSPDVDTLEACFNLYSDVERSTGEEWTRTAAFTFAAHPRGWCGGRGAGGWGGGVIRGRQVHLSPSFLQQSRMFSAQRYGSQAMPSPSPSIVAR